MNEPATNDLCGRTWYLEYNIFIVLCIELSSNILVNLEFFQRLSGNNTRLKTIYFLTLYEL